MESSFRAHPTRAASGPAVPSDGHARVARGEGTCETDASMQPLGDPADTQGDTQHAEIEPRVSGVHNCDEARQVVTTLFASVTPARRNRARRRGAPVRGPSARPARGLRGHFGT